MLTSLSYAGSSVRYPWCWRLPLRQPPPRSKWSRSSCARLSGQSTPIDLGKIPRSHSSLHPTTKKPNSAMLTQPFRPPLPSFLRVSTPPRYTVKAPGHSLSLSQVTATATGILSCLTTAYWGSVSSLAHPLVCFPQHLTQILPNFSARIVRAALTP